MIKDTKDKMIKTSPRKKSKKGTGKKKVEKKKEVAVVESTGMDINGLISKAIEQNISADTMERLLAVRRELKAEFAKEQFFIALANFQKECPTIKKEKPGGETKSGVVAYYYSPIEKLVEPTKESIADNGFSYILRSKTTEKGVIASCIVNHYLGHTEITDVEVPLGTRTGVMSAPQVVAAAITFGTRYAFKNAFGIMTGDDDNDGQTNNMKGAEVKTPEPPKTPPAQTTIYTRAIAMLKVTESSVDLETFKFRMNESDKYTKEEKDELVILINNRIAEIKLKK